MTIDKGFKHWALKSAYGVVSAILIYFLREPLLHKFTVPFFIFPLIAALSVCITLLIEAMLRRKKTTNRFYRQILKPGMALGILGGESPVIFQEWSWINPNIMICYNAKGQEIRAHCSLTILFT